MNFDFKLLKTNFASGLVVFLVALPLCLAIAVASGAEPVAGIISGVIGGLIVGYLSDSHLSVSGPAAGLTAIVLTGITTLGDYHLFTCAVVLAGLFQIIFGLVKAGSISNYFPNNVIEGMLAGIGVIIIRKQIPHALGYDAQNMANEETIFEHGFNFMDYLSTLTNSLHYGAILIATLTIVILFLWDHFKLQSKLRLLPGALVAVTLSIIVEKFIFENIPFLNIQSEHLVNVPIINSFDDFHGIFNLPNFSGLTQFKVWELALTIAVVASIETLLCIEAADKMDIRKRVTNTNRELFAQGIGNSVSGLIGGIPLTSVVVRTSANASSGATHKTSTLIHGVLLAICFLSIPIILNKIPLACLAGILIMIGIKLAKWSLFEKYWKKGKYQFIPFIITLLAVVFLDLLKGVGLGLIISIIFILMENLKRSYYLSKSKLNDVDEIRMDLAEEVSFLNKAAIKRTLYNIPSNSKLIIDASRSAYVASDVIDLIQDFRNYTAKELNIQVEMFGLKEEYITTEAQESDHIKLVHKRTI